MNATLRERTVGEVGWRLTAERLRAWLDAIRQAGACLVAPVREGGLRRFRAVRSPDEIDLTPGKTRWSPKEFVFPRTEPLFTYALDGDGVSLEPAPPPAAPQVLFGVRPCDAAGLRRLDAVLLAADGLYAARRAQTTVVSAVCVEAAPECFCAAVGGSPAGEEGSDVQVAEADGTWLVRPLTAAGRALTAGLEGEPPVPEEAWARVRDAARALGARLGRTLLGPAGPARLEAGFGDPAWEALGRRCLGCGLCTYACPSCSCFDVTDTGSGPCGARCRSWDSCTFALFTRHATGHNPRPTTAARYRQRVLHKFAYFPLRHGGLPMCVGCGRCVALCPVGLDLRAAVARVLGGDGGG